MVQQENLFSAKHHKHFPICTKIFSVFGVSGKKTGTRAPEHSQWAQLTKHSSSAAAVEQQLPPSGYRSSTGFWPCVLSLPRFFAALGGGWELVQGAEAAGKEEMLL